MMVRGQSCAPADLKVYLVCDNDSTQKHPHRGALAGRARPVPHALHPHLLRLEASHTNGSRKEPRNPTTSSPRHINSSANPISRVPKARESTKEALMLAKSAEDRLIDPPRISSTGTAHSHPEPTRRPSDIAGRHQPRYVVVRASITATAPMRPRCPLRVVKHFRDHEVVEPRDGL